MSSVLAEATVGGINTLKDGTIKVTLELQECAPIKAGNLIALNNQHVKFYITSDNISNEIKDELDAYEVQVDEKSPSKRMRNILFRLWEQDKQGYEDYELFYRFRMKQLNEMLKNKLT